MEGSYLYSPFYNRMEDTADSDTIAEGNERRAYIHVQDTPSTLWLIQHNFNDVNRAINIFVINENGVQIVGQVDTLMSTNNLLVYNFAEPLKGYAHINL